MSNELYFDNSSTTRVYPDVVKAMNKIMLNDYGNPSSQHAMGDNANKLIISARKNIAKNLGAKPSEIFFTSGATESNNWVFSGLAHTNNLKKKILISQIEHPSVRETANLFRNWGYQIVEIPVYNDGFIDMRFIEENIDSNTLLVSVIHGNNIFGTIQDLKKIGDICKHKNTLFNTDAAQTFGKLKILVHDWNIDLLSASAHKIGGPKGVGLLYVKESVKFSPLIYGGGQEKGLRSGTENTAGIIGFAKALEISKSEDWNSLNKMRDYLIEKLELLGGRIVGSKLKRIPNNIFVTFDRVDAEKLLYYLSSRGIYISTGSACDSKKEVEDVALKAIGLTAKEMKSSIRISLPIRVTKKDVNYFLNVLKKLIPKI